MSVASFDELLGSVCDVIKEYKAVVRKSIEQPERWLYSIEVSNCKLQAKKALI